MPLLYPPRIEVVRNDAKYDDHNTRWDQSIQNTTKRHRLRHPVSETPKDMRPKNPQAPKRTPTCAVPSLQTHLKISNTVTDVDNLIHHNILRL